MEELLCLNIGNSPFGLSCNILTFWLSFSPSRDVRKGTPRLCVQGSKDCVILIRAEQELVCLQIIMKRYWACSAEKAIPKTTALLISHGFCAFDIALAISYYAFPSATGLDVQFWQAARRFQFSQRGHRELGWLSDCKSHGSGSSQEISYSLGFPLASWNC